MKKIATISIFLFLVLLIAGCTQGQNKSNAISGQTITVYKDQSCGCCGNYVAGLERQGFDVNVIENVDMNSIKEKYGIPSSIQSCHTSVIGDYYIEGHVPYEAVLKLLEEKPEIDGIALPGMPSGSPGMPGSKITNFEIYQMHNEEMSVYMTI